MSWHNTLVRSFLLVALLALPRPALAEKPITVGDGTPASCTEMALKNALIIAEAQGGATINFECGEGPVTITVTEGLIIPDDDDQRRRADYSGRWTRHDSPWCES